MGVLNQLQIHHDVFNAEHFRGRRIQLRNPVTRLRNSEK